MLLSDIDVHLFVPDIKCYVRLIAVIDLCTCHYQVGILAFVLGSQSIEMIPLTLNSRYRADRILDSLLCIARAHGVRSSYIDAE